MRENLADPMLFKNLEIGFREKRFGPHFHVVAIILRDRFKEPVQSRDKEIG